MAKKSYKQSNYRKALIGKIHIAKKQLCLDEDTYRDVLRLATSGLTSCKDMNITELERVLYAMEKKGFKPIKKDHGRKPKKADHNQPTIDKIEAILAENKLHWNYAHGIAKKMFNKEALEFCTPEQLKKVLQALVIYQNRKAN